MNYRARYPAVPELVLPRLSVRVQLDKLVRRSRSSWTGTKPHLALQLRFDLGDDLRAIASPAAT